MLLYQFIIEMLIALKRWKSFFNSLGLSDTIWRQRTGSTLAQVMACCLPAPSHYLSQSWLIMNLMLWHPPENNFIGISNINSINDFANYNFKIITASPRGQWINIQAMQAELKTSLFYISHHFPMSWWLHGQDNPAGALSVQWLGARLWHLSCVNRGDTTVWHVAMDV